MKKLISLILAIIMCFAFSVLSFAAPAVSAPVTSTTVVASTQATSVPTTTVTTTAIPIDESVVEEALEQFEAMIDAESEARYIVATNAMFELYSIINENNVKDPLALSKQMRSYSVKNEDEYTPVFSDDAGLYSVYIILKKFTVGGTFDLNKVQKEIEGSESLDLILRLYTGAYIVRSTQAVSTKAGETTMVENPKTGDSGINAAIAFAVLGLGVATIAVCTKKKEA